MLGEAMFGARWQSDLARALGKSPRVVRFWADGVRVIDGEAVMGVARVRVEGLVALTAGEEEGAA